MDAYVAEIRKLENKFSGLEIHHVVRDNNVAADILSKLGSDRAEVPPGIFVHELHHPSINISTPLEVDPVPQETSREVMMIEADWRTTFIDYIKDKVLPPGIKKDDAKAVRIMHRSKNYVLINNKLYKRGAGSGILIKCVTAEEGKGILQEAHEGTFGNHAASRTLVGKVFRSGFLLANCIIRRRTTRQTMPRMPVLRQTKSLACSQLDNHTSIMVVRLLEP